MAPPVIWHHPETPGITPIRDAPSEPPRDIYVPMSQSVPVAASSLAPVTTPPAHAPAKPLPTPPTPTSNSTAPIPPRVSRELEYEGYVEIPGRTRNETCALRDAHGITYIAMVYHWTMRLWCQCWRKAKQPTKSFANMAPLKTRLACRPRMHRTYLNPTMCPMSRCRPVQTYDDTPCTRSSVVLYMQVPLRRRRPSNWSQT